MNAADDKQWTPLHCASDAGQKDTVQLLVDNGANIEAKNDKEMTPLDLAEEEDEEDIVEILKSAK